MSWWFEEGKVRVASKELAVLDLGKEQQGENYYQMKGPFSPDLGVSPSSTLRPLSPNARIEHQQYLFFPICVSAAMDIGHFAYVCVNVYPCDPFGRSGTDRHFLLW